MLFFSRTYHKDSWLIRKTYFVQSKRCSDRDTVNGELMEVNGASVASLVTASRKYNHVGSYWKLWLGRET